MIVSMDDLTAHVEERRPSSWDSPPPSPKQYTEEIEAIEFGVVASMGVGPTITVSFRCYCRA